MCSAPILVVYVLFLLHASENGLMLYFILKSSLKMEDSQMDFPMFLLPFDLLCRNACRLRVSICPNTGTRLGEMSNCVMYTFTQFSGTLTIDEFSMVSVPLDCQEALLETLRLESQVVHRLFGSRHR